jgi:prolyl-tRNA synthetase
VFCDSDVLDLPVPGEDVDFDGDLLPDRRAMDLASMPRPRTSTTPAGSPRGAEADKRCTARGIEVGQIFYFGTKYS